MESYLNEKYFFQINAQEDSQTYKLACLKDEFFSLRNVGEEELHTLLFYKLKNKNKTKNNHEAFDSENFDERCNLFFEENDGKTHLEKLIILHNLIKNFNILN
ncbi:MAG: hypothetical protein JWM09_404 [Francisellaceae bacterium]|nr:hypothetical protein [Francisellaceae bacterium]